MDKSRYTKANLLLRANLKVETSLKLVNFNVAVIDGLGILHGTVHWSKGVAIADLIVGFICILLMSI